jgi:hypothetical protein
VTATPPVCRAELAAWASQRGLATDQNRLLGTLERRLEIDPSDLDTALDAAAQAVAEALGADKVDAFLFESSTWAASSMPSDSICSPSRTADAWSRSLSSVQSGTAVASTWTWASCAEFASGWHTIRHQCALGSRRRASWRADSRLGRAGVL